MCSQFPCHRANALTPHSSPANLAKPTWPPYRAEAMLSSCATVLSAQTTVGPVERPANRLWKGPRIHKLHNFSTVSRSDRFSPATAAPPTNGAAIGWHQKWVRPSRTARRSDWPSPTLPSPVHPRSLRLDSTVRGVLMEAATEMHRRDMTTQTTGFSRVEPVLFTGRPSRLKKTWALWRPRDQNRCHCWHAWHRFIYIRRRLQSSMLSRRENIFMHRSCVLYGELCIVHTLYPPMHTQLFGEKRETARGPSSGAVSLPCG